MSIRNYNSCYSPLQYMCPIKKSGDIRSTHLSILWGYAENSCNANEILVSSTINMIFGVTY